MGKAKKILLGYRPENRYRYQVFETRCSLMAYIYDYSVPPSSEEGGIIGYTVPKDMRDELINDLMTAEREGALDNGFSDFQEKYEKWLQRRYRKA